MNYRIFSFFLSLLLFGSFAGAHLEAGSDVNKEGFIIDFGYTPERIRAEQPAQFSVNLANQTTKDSSNITSIWTRIRFDDEILFAGEFLSKNGNAVFTYTFPRRGEYDIDLVFRKENLLIVQESFSVSVEENSQVISPVSWYVFGGLGILIVLISVITYLRYERRKRQRKIRKEI